MYDNKFPILSWRRIIIDDIATPYIISDKGIVMNDVTGEFMLVTPDKDNYPVVKLKINGKDKTFKVHRLCCNAFNDNPLQLPEVDHKNRNHWDPSKDNLEHVSGFENIQRLVKLREIEKDNLCNYKEVARERTKYTEFQIVQVCLRLVKNESVDNISRKTSVDKRTVYLIKNGKIWKNISCYFSFNNDGMFDETTIDSILFYINKGFTNEAILNILDIPYLEYFESILNKIRGTLVDDKYKD